MKTEPGFSMQRIKAMKPPANWDGRKDIDRRPRPGAPATIQVGSDQYPATVVRVTAHTVVVLFDGEDGNINRHPQIVFRLHGDTWRNRARSYHLTIGERIEHMYPNF